MIRKHVVVQGLVQGIGFRYTARAEASARAITGYARNRDDGSLELEVEGGETSVASMVEWLRQGPPGAVIESLDVTDAVPRNDGEFRILR